MKKFLLSLAAAIAVTVGVAVATTSVDAEKPVSDNIQICHASNSAANPYTNQSTDPDSLGSGNGGDHSQHVGSFPDGGPVASTTVLAALYKATDIVWGDIIPPNGDYAGLNWTPEGQAVYNNGCAALDDCDEDGTADIFDEDFPCATPSPTPTPEATPSPTPTDPPTSTPTEIVTPTPTAPPVEPTPTPTPVIDTPPPIATETPVVTSTPTSKAPG